MSYRLLSVSFISRKIYPLINNKTQRDMDVQPWKHMYLTNVTLWESVYVKIRTSFQPASKGRPQTREDIYLMWGEILASEIEDRLEAHD